MLTDIYARSMLTAARQDCVRLRDLPPAKPLPKAYSPPPRRKGALTRLAGWLLNPRPKTRCVAPQNI